MSRRGRGGPFAALVVREGEVIARGTNRVTTKNDPTAHAEVEAIRAACASLSDFQLRGCTLYTTCEPCPMCMGAIYWARPDRVVYAGTRQDAAAAGFDDAIIYDELTRPPEARRIPMIPLLREEGQRPFRSVGAGGRAGGLLSGERARRPAQANQRRSPGRDWAGCPRRGRWGGTCRCGPGRRKSPPPSPPRRPSGCRRR